MNRKFRFIPSPSVALVVVGLSLAGLSGHPGESAEHQQGDRAGSRPRVLVSTKGDSPVLLQISDPERAGLDPFAPQVEVVITNTSNKVVSAYAVRHDVGSNGELRAAGAELTRANSERSVLWPGDSQTITIGGTHYSSPIGRLVVSVDFLEFTDGTMWGGDTYSSREVIAGMRAGEAATVNALRGLLAVEGISALKEALERSDDDASIPVGHSPKWQEGFERGMSLVKERVKHEAIQMAPAEIEMILARPIDALDEIKRRSNR